MSERLTRKMIADPNEYICKDCPQNENRLRCSFDCGYCKTMDSVFNKLGQIEDFMEEEKVVFVTDLINEFKSNKIDKEIFRKQSNRLYQENQSLKSRWEKLQKWLKEKYSEAEPADEDISRLGEEYISKTERQHFITHILGEMQYLEKESKDERTRT